MAMMTVYHGGYQAVEKPEIRIPDHGILLVRKHPGLVPLALQHIGEKLLRPCIGKTSLFDPFHRRKIIRSHRTKNRLRLSRGLRLIATILCIFVVIIRIFMNIVYFHYILLFCCIAAIPNDRSICIPPRSLRRKISLHIQTAGNESPGRIV